MSVGGTIDDGVLAAEGIPSVDVGLVVDASLGLQPCHGEAACLCKVVVSVVEIGLVVTNVRPKPHAIVVYGVVGEENAGEECRDTALQEAYLTALLVDDVDGGGVVSALYVEGEVDVVLRVDDQSALHVAVELHLGQVFSADGIAGGILVAADDGGDDGLHIVEEGLLGRSLLVAYDYADDAVVVEDAVDILAGKFRGQAEDFVARR